MPYIMLYPVRSLSWRWCLQQWQGFLLIPGTWRGHVSEARTSHWSLFCASLQRERKCIILNKGKVAKAGDLPWQCSAVYSCHANCNCQPALAEIRSRTLLRLSGPDVMEFLQGLVTNDVGELGPEKPAMHAMMLNVQGRVLFDLILYHVPSSSSLAVLVECAQVVKDDLVKLLRFYKIRKKVDITDCSAELRVLASVTGSLSVTSNPSHLVICVADPRVLQFGQRLIVPTNYNVSEVVGGWKEEDELAYHEKRYLWGIAEGTTDLPLGKALPLESNLEFTNGVSFTKGCYVGQELTARSHHTGVIRKRLMPLIFERPPDAVQPGESISSQSKDNVGMLRGVVGVVGLGLMRVAECGSSLKIQPEGKEPISLAAKVPLWWPNQE